MLVLTGWRRVRGVAFVMAPSYANRLVGDCGISVASFRGKGYSGGGEEDRGGWGGVGSLFLLCNWARVVRLAVLFFGQSATSVH